MLANIALDGFVGAVPLVGDAFDVMWRSNRRNVQLLREWLSRARPCGNIGRPITAGPGRETRADGPRMAEMKMGAG
jgi:hypothetical protein